MPPKELKGGSASFEVSTILKGHAIPGDLKLG